MSRRQKSFYRKVLFKFINLVNSLDPSIKFNKDCRSRTAI